MGVFFVLSGYLITDLMMKEWEKTGQIDWCHFWFRRAKRLLPGVLLFLIVLAG
ncbi:hypothetical protein [Salibacterium qingdaonense]|uniref:hypothetical protein n=1 Tax=Salibacterium qingdaonense TaxID=266892 RepID=UPI0015A5C661|nr:hypothetical protein [Salibacterium qingdaonense]